MRGSSASSISLSSLTAPPLAPEYPTDRSPRGSLGTRNSTIEFQALHSVHCPSHLLNSAPHSLQTKAVLRLAIFYSVFRYDFQGRFQGRAASTTAAAATAATGNCSAGCTAVTAAAVM